ncbi:MAG: acyl-CoA dehydrogenase [Actinomyces sp.]|nr:MAG: acyl-CoA dehydrogenase [Actinomyces sp.]
MEVHDHARADLARWREELPDDPWAADELWRPLTHARVDAARAAELDRRAGDFGRRVVEVVGPALARAEHRHHLPRLERYDGIGRRVEEVVFDGEYHRAGRAVWASGLVADSAVPGRAHEQASLLYLLSAEGEAGHACPATCTIGLARALRRRADEEVRERFLGPLVVADYDRAERASQFLTEVQGGSDVGANATRAEPAGDGVYWISGEKWFCSVADADQFLLTARVPGGPAGTRGLGCFVMPRHLDGRPNGFVLRRLKDKLGTRAMASAEIDLDGAVAWPIGPVEEGFRTAVGVVLNTSRWMTAVGSTGMMRRALVEAEAYARHRRAFGRPIGAFALVAETLARMRARWAAAVALCVEVTELEDRIDAGRASDLDVAWHRFCVNAVKYHASVTATAVVRDAIEVLGGNGTIEDFSVLPRLYRDAIVYESWEGTHNVLVTQVLHDCARLPLLDAVRERVGAAVGSGPASWGDELTGLLDRAKRAVDDPENGPVELRRVLDALLPLTGAGLLAEAGCGDEAALVDEYR